MVPVPSAGSCDGASVGKASEPGVDSGSDEVGENVGVGRVMGEAIWFGATVGKKVGTGESPPVGLMVGGRVGPALHLVASASTHSGVKSSNCWMFWNTEAKAQI